MGNLLNEEGLRKPTGKLERIVEKLVTGTWQDNRPVEKDDRLSKLEQYLLYAIEHGLQIPALGSEGEVNVDDIINIINSGIESGSIAVNNLTSDEINKIKENGGLIRNQEKSKHFGLLLNNCTVTTNISGTNCSIDSTSANVVASTLPTNTALKFTSNVAGGTAYVDFTMDESFEAMKDEEQISFWFYPQDTGIWQGMKVYISSTTDLSTYFVKSFVKNDLIENTWNLISIPKSQFTTTTDESWSNRMLTIRVESVTLAGCWAVGWVGNLRLYTQQKKGRVIFTFDDGNITNYTVAYPKLASKGFKGNCYIISDEIDNGVRMTKTQIQDLYANGWDICNHTSDHTDLATLSTSDEIITKVNDCAEYLIYNDMPRGAYHLAYPLGNTSSTVITALQSMKIKTSRLAWLTYNKIPLTDFLRIRSQVTDTTTTLTALKTIVDNAEKYGYTVVFFTHDILTGATGVNTETTTFNSLVDYVATKDLDVCTLSEFYSWLYE